MTKITASNLESFRFYSQYDFITLEELEKRLRGEEDFEETPEMIIGKKYHEFVLRPDFPNPDIVGFDPDTASRSREGLEQAQFEVWANETMRIGNQEHYVVSRMDALTPGSIIDMKVRTNGKAFKVENYFDSLQWPLYCRIYGVSHFVYRLVRLEKLSELWVTTEVQDVPLFYDAGKEEVLNHWIQQFVAFCESRNIEP